MTRPRRGLLRSRSAASVAAAVITLGVSEIGTVREAARRLLAFGLRIALRLRSRRLEEPLAARVAVVAPHPDDETLGCGATIAGLTRLGVPVGVVFVTSGENSHPGEDPAQLLEVRRSEALAALGHLGVPAAQATFLAGRDGSLGSLQGSEEEALRASIAAWLEAQAPEAVLLPCRRDLSDEHEAVHRMVAKALGSLGRPVRVLEFPIWAWRNPLSLVGPLFSCPRIWRSSGEGALGAKQAAIAAHRSQTADTGSSGPVVPPQLAREVSRAEEFLFEWDPR